MKPHLRTKHTNEVDKLQSAVPYHNGSPIQFNLFPEGGYLVSGLETRLAFKAVDTKGEPLEVEGILFGNGDTLLRFQSIHA